MTSDDGVMMLVMTMPMIMMKMKMMIERMKIMVVTSADYVDDDHQT